MAYVIAQPCIGVKDTACVTSCPVDAIHPNSTEVGSVAADQLFIDPVACIDCGICVGECPVNAIFSEDDLPPEWRSFVEKNAAYFKR